MLAALQHFLETSGSPSRCCRRLGLHANTVTQRIRRIEELLGHPIDPEDHSLRVAPAASRRHGPTAPFGHQRSSEFRQLPTFASFQMELPAENWNLQTLERRQGRLLSGT
ncbi:helix-turn-helix domain-containing protein [Mycolicibacterium nivoides]|uniref:helix-turn-helix domain-containing protein n=1 Tax=Mycolicibacterium nivoides TaxID=2487344 RepID=UPI000F5BA71B